ncbi:MAG TPA: AzlC family ABC transporter permease [Azospirillaceae bacterium]|nr:AzlC family ABC transporter permease [Azospirillaceae bacterium]
MGTGGAESTASARRAVIAGAVREAAGLPSLVLGASYLGFGSVVHQSGLDVWHGLVSTLTAWALPGQIAAIELYATGASLAVIALAVALTNARLFPMTVSLMPRLRHPGLPRWRMYLYAHLVAVTGWAFAMRRAPALPVEHRAAYFVAFAGTIWAASLVCTVVGFLLAGSVPGPVALGLVFLNPIYFMLVFAADARGAARILSLVLGAALGPPLHALSPGWGLMVTGLVAGSLAFAAGRVGAGRGGNGGG